MSHVMNLGYKKMPTKNQSPNCLHKKSLIITFDIHIEKKVLSHHHHLLKAAFKEVLWILYLT